MKKEHFETSQIWRMESSSVYSAFYYTYVLPKLKKKISAAGKSWLSFGLSRGVRVSSFLQTRRMEFIGRTEQRLAPAARHWKRENRQDGTHWIFSAFLLLLKKK